MRDSAYQCCTFVWVPLFSLHPDCSTTSCVLISMDFILCSVEGCLLSQYKMTKAKVKIVFYGRQGSGLAASGRCGGGTVCTEELHVDCGLGANRFVPSPGYFPPKSFLCTVCCIMFMCYDCLEGCELNLNEFLSKRHCENKCNSIFLSSSPHSGSPHLPSRQSNHIIMCC